jgi:hypothetical protein
MLRMASPGLNDENGLPEQMPGLNTEPFQLPRMDNAT